MKNIIVLMSLLFSCSLFADTNDLATNCIKHWDNPNNDIINACNNITQQAAQDCVTALKNGSSDLINACASMNNQFSVACVKAWSAPNSDMIKACGSVSTQDAANCIVAIKTGNSDVIKACGNIDNQFSASCVGHWGNPSSDMIKACRGVSTQFAADCIAELKSGNSDTIKACARVKDQYGISCVKKAEDKTFDKINLCAIVDSLPNTNMNCVHCTAEQQATNIKIISDYDEAAKANSKIISEKLEKILNDKDFKKTPDLFNLYSNCMMELMLDFQDLAQYVSTGNAYKKELPTHKNCKSIIEKYDSYVAGTSTKKSGFGWFK